MGSYKKHEIVSDDPMEGQYKIGKSGSESCDNSNYIISRGREECEKLASTFLNLQWNGAGCFDDRVKFFGCFTNGKKIYFSNCPPAQDSLTLPQYSPICIPREILKVTIQESSFNEDSESEGCFDGSTL